MTSIVRAYFDMRRERRSQEELDKTADQVAIDRARVNEYNAVNDPIRISEARYRGNAAGRTEDQQSASQPGVMARIPQYDELKQNEYERGIAEHPVLMEGIENTGRTQRRDEEVAALAQPNRVENVRRTGIYDANKEAEEAVAHPVRMQRTRFQGNQDVREEEVSRLSQPGKVGDIQRADELVGQEHKNKMKKAEQEGIALEGLGEEQASYLKYQRLVRNQAAELTAFDQDNDPTHIENLYNDVDDGQSARIIPMGEDMYLFTHSSGHTEPVSKQRLLEGTKEMTDAWIEAHRQGYSSDPGYNPRTGAGGGKNAKLTADEREWDRIVYNLAQLPQYQDMSRAEIEMEAHALMSKSAGKTDDEAADDFYENRVEEMLKMNRSQLRAYLGLKTGEPVTREMIDTAAEDMTQDYLNRGSRTRQGGVASPEPTDEAGAGMLGNGAPGSAPAPEVEADTEQEVPTGFSGGQRGFGKSDYTVTPAMKSKLIKFRDNPRYIAGFDQYFGEGAAQQILDSYEQGNIQ